MERNERFEAILTQIRQDNQEELKIMSLLDYVKTNIDANQYFFFTADSDEEVNKLNSEFIEYIS